MRKNKKLRTARISTTLPQVMVEDFKVKAEMTGLSISRLIYLQLKARKPVIIVSNDLIQEVKSLRKIVDKIGDTGKVDAETLEILQQQLHFYESLVNLERGVEVHVL